jgi:hypothetical protein
LWPTGFPPAAPGHRRGQYNRRHRRRLAGGLRGDPGRERTNPAGLRADRPVPGPARRHVAAVAAHGAECRLCALAAWAFPDLWRACGGHRMAQPVLRRWAHRGGLSRARLDTIPSWWPPTAATGNPATGRTCTRPRSSPFPHCCGRRSAPGDVGLPHMTVKRIISRHRDSASPDGQTKLSALDKGPDPTHPMRTSSSLVASSRTAKRWRPS